jgi:hypothetical protein
MYEKGNPVTLADQTPDIITETEKNLDLMVKYHYRLELMENYFPVTGSL